MDAVDVAGLLRTISKEGTWGWAHLRIWSQLRDFILSHETIYRRAPCFFDLTMIAHADMAALALTKLLDDHPQAMGIGYLLSVVGHQTETLAALTLGRDPLFQVTAREIAASVKKDKALLGQFRKQAEGINTMRDKVIAHVDRGHATDPEKTAKLLEASKTSREVMDSLFTAIRDLVNWYEMIVEGAKYTWEVVNWNDFGSLTPLLHAVELQEGGSGDS